MDFNEAQFGQPGPGQRAFRGFGDQAMRHYRVDPSTPASDPGPQQSATPSGWTQPELPDPPAAPASPARLTPAAQARADIASARAQARAARVATAQANAQAATHRQTLAEARASQLGQRAADATRPAQAPPVPSAVPDLTPPTPTASPSGPSRQVTINNVAYRAQGQRFGPPPAQPPAAPAASIPPMPAAPPPPTTAPPTTPLASGISPGLARAGRYAGAGLFVAAKALQSINRTATDPKRSGNPLYKSSQGWMRS